MKTIAIVTGANRGIGFEIARQLGKLDVTVVMTARKEDEGHSAGIKRNGRRIPRLQYFENRAECGNASIGSRIAQQWHNRQFYVPGLGSHRHGRVWRVPRALDEGADTAVWLAKGEVGATGKFYRDREVISW